MIPIVLPVSKKIIKVNKISNEYLLNFQEVLVNISNLTFEFDSLLQDHTDYNTQDLTNIDKFYALLYLRQISIDYSVHLAITNGKLTVDIEDLRSKIDREFKSKVIRKYISGLFIEFTIPNIIINPSKIDGILKVNDIDIRNAGRDIYKTVLEMLPRTTCDFFDLKEVSNTVSFVSEFRNEGKLIIPAIDIDPFKDLGEILKLLFSVSSESILRMRYECSKAGLSYSDFNIITFREAHLHLNMYIEEQSKHKHTP